MQCRYKFYSAEAGKDIKNLYCSAFTPYGDVHMFRMQLWASHLQTWEESFRYPGTLETTQRVKEMSWSVVDVSCQLTLL